MKSSCWYLWIQMLFSYGQSMVAFLYFGHISSLYGEVLSSGLSTSLGKTCFSFGIQNATVSSQRYENFRNNGPVESLKTSNKVIYLIDVFFFFFFFFFFSFFFCIICRHFTTRKTLWEHAYSNILQKITQNFQIKNTNIFLISALNIDCGYS